jgi:hypothetical protein
VVGFVRSNWQRFQVIFYPMFWEKNIFWMVS